MAGVGGMAGCRNGFANMGEGFARHAYLSGGFGQLPDGQGTRDAGLCVVVGGTLVGKHTQDAAEVLVVDTAVDDVQVAVGYFGEFLQHGCHTVGVVCRLADGEGTVVYLLPTAMQAGVLNHADYAVADMLRGEGVAYRGQQVEGSEEGG